MKYLQILDGNLCSTNIESCCSDYGIATYIYIIKNALNIIHMIVPIILIVMVTIQLTKLLMHPDDPNNKEKKSLYNKVFAAVAIFFMPTTVNVVLGILPTPISLSGCWQAADDIVTIMKEEEAYQEEQNYSQVKEYDEDSSVGLKSDTVSTKKKKSSSKKNSSSNKSSSKNSDSVTDERDKIVKYAKKFLGNKYIYGGTSLTNGTDCSGFTMRVYEHFGYNLPRTSGEQSKVGTKVSLKNIKKGDLLFYNHGGRIGHVSMYIGNGKVIHASNPSSGIKISSVNYRTPTVIRRIIK